MSDRTITIPITNDTEVELDEEFRVTLSSAAGGATLEGSATLDVGIDDNDANANPPPGDGGGGGALDLVSLTLLGLRGATSKFAAARYDSGRASEGL